MKFFFALRRAGRSMLDNQRGLCLTIATDALARKRAATQTAQSELAMRLRASLANVSPRIAASRHSAVAASFL